MNIMDKLQAVENKFLELESLISDPSVLEDMNKWQRYNREHSSMQPIIEAYREYKTIDEIEKWPCLPNTASRASVLKEVCYSTLE